MESVSVSHRVVELIMERLPVKSLLSFKAVSKKWKSTIRIPVLPRKTVEASSAVWRSRCSHGVVKFSKNTCVWFIIIIIGQDPLGKRTLLSLSE
ncbi:unnamed protein product [Eruca vesicaria subsp. sativa]|uniref:F-box domain-containing protein n=1 Tax=Eruca vesicaria subsp. sativa TaxID=29727 RepID=A0ABC8KCI1_ERUVS|nr:unnamed protein product [Eruca vesicaria subsp. sativa]